MGTLGGKGLKGLSWSKDYLIWAILVQELSYKGYLENMTHLKSGAISGIFF